MRATTDKLTLSGILCSASPKVLVFAITLGLFAGLFYALIIPFLLNILEFSQATAGGPVASGDNITGAETGLATMDKAVLAALFFGNCLLILVAKSVSLVTVNYLAKGATTKLRLRLYNKIQQLPIANIEKLGMPRIINILTHDIHQIAGIAVSLPLMWISCITVVGLFAYLFYLSLQVFLLVFAALGVAVLIYRFPALYAQKLMLQSRAKEDEIQEGIKGLVMGCYELKLNAAKSAEYINDTLVNPESEALQMGRKGEGVMLVTGTYADLISFFIIGSIVFFMMDSHWFNGDDLFGIVMLLLYIIGPLGIIMGSLPALKKGKISLQHIRLLEDQLDETNSSDYRVKPWHTLNLSNLSYSYAKSDGEGFQLNPINLKLEKGSINFIIGGNGSGKSTLSKLISLHFLPDQGCLEFDSQRVNDENRSAFRSKISSIYSNYYLFRKLYGFGGVIDEQRLSKYLSYFELDKKTQFVNGEFTTTSLSDGQRRRLALVTALLEDREVYIFDEWAADQDPRFKKVFYTKVLRELRDRNKLVLVITHDDRYFHCADKLVFMADGGIEKIETSNKHRKPENISA